MTHPEGGFYSAEDADSEGIKGKFYVWSPDEIMEILGQKDGEWFCQYYGITPEGNFEGKSIPNRIHTQNLAHENEGVIAPLREKVFAARERRVHPHKDDKILTSWNGLMIAAMAIVGRVLNKPQYTKAAQKALDFILENLINEDGRLLARYRDGDAAYLAYLDDYAFLVWGLIELYQTTFDAEYLHKAIEFNKNMLDLFHDKENGGLFLYAKDGEKLIARPKEVYDGALPSGNSVAALNMLRLARITGDYHLEEKAYNQLNAFASIVQKKSFSTLIFSNGGYIGIISNKGDSFSWR
ncbi:MAG: thioredoxin domain-containing protein [Clostridiales bacterium]|nr:thioredoxin domain-containing protein [Clostridiales bacterium]